MLSIFLRTTKWIAVLSTVFLMAQGSARAENWQVITLNVTKIDVARRGQIHALVFLQDGFPIHHDKALKSYFAPITSERMTLMVNVPVDVSFAIKVHHDEDSNNKVTKNWTGIFPAEGLGFSAGAKMMVMPPTFSAAKMSLPDDRVVFVPIIYP